MSDLIDGFWSAEIAPLDAFIRLAASGVLCALIGIDRELADRPAGLRTHIMVGLAATLFTIISTEMFYWVRTLEEETNADPLRLLEAITAGVAFLAAGTIFRNDDTVKGLTTGTGLWMAGAIGMACGQGMFGLATMAGLIAVFVLTVLRRLTP